MCRGRWIEYRAPPPHRARKVLQLPWLLPERARLRARYPALPCRRGRPCWDGAAPPLARRRRRPREQVGQNTPLSHLLSQGCSIDLDRMKKATESTTRDGCKLACVCLLLNHNASLRTDYFPTMGGRGDAIASLVSKLPGLRPSLSKFMEDPRATTRASRTAQISQRSEHLCSHGGLPKSGRMLTRRQRPWCGCRSSSSSTLDTKMIPPLQSLRKQKSS